MKKFIVVSALIVVSLSSLLAQKTEIALTSKVSISFPTKAEKLPAPNAAMVIYSTNTQIEESYAAVSFDLSSMGMTGEMIAGMGDMLSTQMKAGIVAQLKGATITKDEKVSFKGKDAIYMEIDGKDAETETIKGKKGFMYIFFIDATMYNFTFYSSKTTAKLEDAKEFFESVKIN